MDGIKRETLQAIVKRAMDGGWKNTIFWFSDQEIAFGSYYEMLFDLDFAKAFWGESEVCGNCYEAMFPNTLHQDLGVLGGEDVSECQLCELVIDPVFNWQYHLQQMILKKDKIKYLKQFL